MTQPNRLLSSTSPGSFEDVAGTPPSAATALGGGASSADVGRFQQAMQRGLEPASAVEVAAPVGPAAGAQPAEGARNMGDAILDSLGRLSRQHQETQSRIERVLAAPDTELTARRMLEVQASLGSQAINTQFIAGVSNQLTRVIDQTVRVQ